MAKVFQVETTDEITELVGRVREMGDEADVLFVIPADAQIVQSPNSLKLLLKYSHQMGKKAAIISTDPHVHVVGKTAGFPIYATVQAFENGLEAPGPAAYADDLPGPAVTEIEHEHGPGPAPFSPPRRNTTKPQASGAKKPPTGPPFKLFSRPMYYAAAAVGVVALVMFGLFAPRATVTVTITASPISVYPVIQGSTDPNSKGTPDHVVTQLVTADMTSQFTATPTGTKIIPPTPGTGSVVITSDLSYPLVGKIPQYEEFDTSGSPALIFRATQDTYVCIPGSKAGGACPSGSNGNSVPVQADPSNLGPVGNVDANTITKWPESGDVCLSLSCSSNDFTVTNPQALTGGVGQTTQQIVSDADLAAWNAKLSSVKSSLSSQITGTLQQQAKGNNIAQDQSGGGKTVSFDVSPPLPNSGDVYQQTTIVVAGHGKAATYSIADIQQAVLADLTSQVPQGQILAPNPTIVGPQITQAQDNGIVVFSVSASGYSQQKVDLKALQSSLAGQTVSGAKKQAQLRLAGSVLDVSVTQWPLPFPFLPFISQNITVKENVVPQKTS